MSESIMEMLEFVIFVFGGTVLAIIFICIAVIIIAITKKIITKWIKF